MLEKIINRVYITGGLVIVVIVIMSMTSCGSSKHYKGCDGKKKFKTNMNNW